MFARFFSAWSLSCPRGRAGEEVETFDDLYRGNRWSGRFGRVFFHRRVDCQLCRGAASHLNHGRRARVFRCARRDDCRCVRIYRRGLAGFAPAWGARCEVAIGGIAAFALIIVSAASAVGIWYSMQPHVLNRNGPEPLLRLEIRAPQNIAIFADATAELTTDRNTADVVLEKADETATRRGYVPLYYRTSHRLLRA